VERIVFGNGKLSAEALPELGGRLTRLRYGAHDVLVPVGADPARPPRWPKGGAYPLAPYSNRIENARLSHAGRVHRLEPHPDAVPHALHGHAHLREWRVTARDASSLTMVYAHEPDAHWPWAFSVEQRFTIDGATLAVAIELVNRATTTAPAGIGWHPYFAIRGTPQVALTAAGEWPQNDANLPLGRIDPAPAGKMALGPEGGTRYLGGWDGKALFETGTGLTLALAADSAFGHLVVHRPAGIDYLCLEPVSHVANGFNLAAAGSGETGTIILEPGESLTGRLTLTVDVSGAISGA
jgi:aldose 1-epimerase